MDTNLQNILTFKTMITPMVIQVFFWIAVALVVISGLGAIFAGKSLYGLGMILLGPIMVRIYVELIIVIFKINEGVQKMSE